jgi:hypothetical protein
MAASEVDVCNQALLQVGSDTITTLTENSNRARLCLAVFGPTRDELLSQYMWNFATTRVNLGGPNVLGPIWGFTNSFNLPGDFLRLWETDLTAGSYGHGNNAGGIPYAIEGRVLAADTSAVNIVYSRQITDVGVWSPGFRRCVYLSIASKIAFTLTRNVRIAEALHALFEDALLDARTKETQENANVKVGSNPFRDARFVSGSANITLDI